MRPVRYTLMEHISAPIDQVFAALIDPRSLERWLPGCAGVAVEGPIRKGTRLKVQFGRRFTELDVVDFAPPRTFGWVERGQRKDYKTFFQLDPTGGATAVTIQEVWTPSSLTAWIRGRFFPKRNVQRHQKEILRNLRNILTP
jgi:uncharacterized protein YndB with AHSA1/START domain